VARSDRHAPRLRRACAFRIGAALAVGVMLAGCTTTQHEAQRLQLDSARQRAALRPTRVTLANATVVPTSVAIVDADGKTAFVVRIRNEGRRAVTDLPISVGYERPHRARVYLNAASGLRYFQAHLPAIPAHRSLTWIYTASRSLPRGARPFAVVGRRRSAPALLTEMDVRIGVEYGHASATSSVVVHLDNPSGVPQFELQVYVYARADGRYVAAGNATVSDLGAGDKQRVGITLVGEAASGLHVEAVPTILQ
jgi:uncharacterized lipoprotein YmbA